jgi:hypothetical protein
MTRNGGPEAELLERFRGSRLVFERGKVVGLAMRTSRPFEWKIVRFEGPLERLFRTAAIDLIAASVGDPAPDPASVPDRAATVAGFAISPGRLVSAVYQAAVQVAASSLMPGFPATVLKTVAEAALAEVLPKRHEGVVRTMEVLAVAYDIEQGRQTELVERLTLGEIAAAVKDITAGIPEPAAVDELKRTRVITPGELHRLQGQEEPGGLPRPGGEIRKPPPPPPPPPPGENVVDPPRLRRLRPRDPGGDIGGL